MKREGSAGANCTPDGRLNHILKVAPEIAVFATLALGQTQGRRKFGGFRLQGVTGSLIVAHIIGQLGSGASA